MKSIWNKLMGNAVVRFCFSHMLILLLVTVSCFLGFQSAFQIVQNNIMEENSHFLSEGGEAIDDYFSTMLNMMGGRQDVWYATCIQVAEYLKAIRRLILSTSMKKIYNPSAIAVWVEANGKTVSIPGGEEISLSE